MHILPLRKLERYFPAIETTKPTILTVLTNVYIRTAWSKTADDLSFMTTYYLAASWV